jgi:hypothetical protein
MRKFVRAVVKDTDMFLVALTEDQAIAVSGGRWKEEIVPAPPVLPPGSGGAAINNAWGIYDPGGVGTGPGVYGECYLSPTCDC